MIERLFDSPNFTLLNKSLDVASLRNSVIADNIANIDTPGFKRREVVFEEKLQNALTKSNNQGLNLKITDDRHISVKVSSDIHDLKPDVLEIKDFSFRNDDNNVDIDVESAKLAKNKLYYDSIVQSMNNEIRLIRLAITGRG